MTLWMLTLSPTSLCLPNYKFPQLSHLCIMDMHVKSMHNVGTRHVDIVYTHYTEIYGVV
jgi:hypothetical protein